jgi:hypothetical protein
MNETTPGQIAVEIAKIMREVKSLELEIQDKYSRGAIRAHLDIIENLTKRIRNNNKASFTPSF